VASGIYEGAPLMSEQAIVYTGRQVDAHFLELCMCGTAGLGGAHGGGRLRG